MIVLLLVSLTLKILLIIIFWHHRLAHPFEGILQYICNEFLNVHFNKNYVCESCHLAKQHRFPFAQSDHVVKYILELIHIDI